MILRYIYLHRVLMIADILLDENHSVLKTCVDAIADVTSLDDPEANQYDLR